MKGLLVVVGMMAVIAAQSQVPFKLDVGLEHVSGDSWNLVMDLDIGEGDWVVSALSTDSMFGKVDVEFLWPAQIQITGPMQEYPPSKEEVERFSQLEILVLKEDTRMVLPLTLMGMPTVVWKGRIWFVLEPLCMPFSTEFDVVPDGRGGVVVQRVATHLDWPPGR